MPIIGWHTLEEYLAAKEEVIRAAEGIVDRWARDQERWHRIEPSPEAARLEQAVRALRSFYADRGLRDPGTPRQQEPDAEQAHGETVH